MRSRPSSRVCSQSSRGHMKNTNTPKSLFTHDLEALSHGSSGRRLMKLLESLSLDTLGALSPTELAQRLQVESPEVDSLVGLYLEVAATNRELVSLVMVAIAPRVDVVIRRNVGFAPSAEFLDELVMTLLEALQMVGQQPTSKRRRWLAEKAVNTARSRVRFTGRGTLPSVPLSPEIDVEEPEDHTYRVSQLLNAMWTGVAEGVISLQEFAVINCSRVWGDNLVDLAESLNDTYDELRMRRSRAEDRLRSFILNFEEVR